MKTKELIEELKKFDPEKEVIIGDDETCVSNIVDNLVEIHIY